MSTLDTVDLPIPINDAERVKCVCNLEQLDTPAEERFDRLTRIAERLFRTPFVMMTLIEKDRQWFKSARGHLFTETPRADSFCQYTLFGRGPLVVNNAAIDEKYATLPAVAEMGIKFYAGVPVTLDDGFIVGTLCVLDFEERDFPDSDLQALTDIAHCIESELRLESFLESEKKLLAEMDQLKRKSSTDPVARCWNNEFGREVFERMLAETKPDSRSGLGILMLNLDRLAEVNGQFGEEVGNLYLREAANRIRMALRGEASLSRGGPATFRLLIPKLKATNAETTFQTIVDRLGDKPFQHKDLVLPMDATAAYAIHSGARRTASELVAMILKAMIRAKEQGPGSLRQAL